MYAPHDAIAFYPRGSRERFKLIRLCSILESGGDRTLCKGAPDMCGHRRKSIVQMK